MNQHKAGVVLSYASEAIKILSHLIYTPIMIRILGQSDYGLYQLVFSVVAYLSLFNFGFTASYVRFYSRFRVEEDEDGIARLNGMYLIIFLFIAAIVILCGGIMVSNIHIIFKDGLSEAEYERASILMIILIFSMTISFPNSVFSCIISAHERFFFQRLMDLLCNLLNPFLTLPLLFLGYGSIGIVSVSSLMTLLLFLLNIWYVFRKLHVRFLFNHLQFSLFRTVWLFTFFIFLNQIIDQINWNVDKYLLGRMIDTSAVAVYGLGSQINLMYKGISTSVSSVFVPRINAIVANKAQDAQLSRMFIRIGRIQFMLLSLILSGFVFFGKPFMNLWGGEGYEDSFYVALWLIVPVTVPLIQNIGIEIQRAQNKHRTRSIVYFCIAVGNVFLSIPLIRQFGVKGAALGTAISVTAGNIVFMNWYYYKKIGLEIKTFWLKILAFWKALIYPVLMGLLFMNFVNIYGWLDLMLYIFIYTVVFSISMWHYGMNQDERKLVLGAFHHKDSDKVKNNL